MRPQNVESFQLQRLVDGELDYREIRQLLKDAENEPSSWRLIASAFVEDQIWKAEFSEQLERSESEPVSGVAAAGTAENHHAPRMWWLSLAASVALALSVGFLIGQGEFATGNSSSGTNAVAGGGEGPDQSVPSQPPSAIAQATNGGDDLKMNPAVYHMQLQDPKGNQFMDSDIPLYPVKQSNDLRRLGRAEIPVAIRKQARNSGYHVQQDIRYVSGRLKDGRQFVIPIRNYRFSPNQ